MMAPMATLYPVRGRDAHEHGDEREADAHDDGQARPYAPQREQLDERSDARDEHGALHQHAQLIVREAGRRAHDEDGREVRHEHREDVLDAVGNGRGRRGCRRRA